MTKQTHRWLTLVAVAALAACSGEGRTQFLSLGTAGTGGIYYPLGGAIASRLSPSQHSQLKMYSSSQAPASVP